MDTPSKSDESAELLAARKASAFWIQQRFRKFDTAVSWRAVLMLLVWQLSTGICFNLFMRPTSILLNSGIHESLYFSSLTFVIFLLSPLAGFFADTKFGRMRVLVFGTCTMLLSTSVTLVVGICLVADHSGYNATSKGLLAIIIVTLAVYCLGYVLFVSNIVQFGTDQLRDAPTRCSVSFICAYVWTDGLGNLVAMTTNVPGHEITVSSKYNLVAADTLRGSLVVVLLFVSALVTVIVLYLVLKKKSKWFLLEHSAQNPYKLVYGVLHFALLHKKPIRRSAFTFCENVRPSRLDFGKRRYGGPYSTEQVEDVKVMLDMLKVLVALGPVFLLEGAACSSFLKHLRNYALHYYVNAPLTFMFTKYGMTESVCTLVFVPLWQCVARPLLGKFSPNMFKRMGMAVCLYIISFLLYFSYDVLAFSNSDRVGYCYSYCSTNVTNLLNFNHISLPSSYVSVLQQVLYSLSYALLYISAYEFLCSQSPQYMKGLLFGLFYTLRTFYQYLAILTVWSFTFMWNSTILSCCSGYSLLSIGIGVTTLILYSIIAKKYKYRKRDDICNIYKFAEDYYSNIQ